MRNLRNGLPSVWVTATTGQQCSAQEYCEDCPEQSKLVRRDAAFKDNNSLPAQIALRAGDFVYDGLRNGFRVSSQTFVCLQMLMH